MFEKLKNLFERVSNMKTQEENINDLNTDSLGDDLPNEANNL